MGASLDMTGKRPYSRRRFRELLLYVADKSRDDPKFGATKLNKIMFYADLMAYGLHGKSITGARYMKLDWGPAPQALCPVQDDLIEEGHAHLVEGTHFNWPQRRLVPDRKPDLSIFDEEEIELVDAIVVALQGKNATEASELSHCEVGWKLAGHKEDIPYTSVFISDRALTGSEVSLFQELAKENGWT